MTINFVWLMFISQFQTVSMDSSSKSLRNTVCIPTGSGAFSSLNDFIAVSSSFTNIDGLVSIALLLLSCRKTRCLYIFFQVSLILPCRIPK